MQPPGTRIVFYPPVRIIWTIYVLLWSTPIFGQGKIREVYVPQEVVSGDSFVVAIVANAPKAGIERMAAVNVPTQMKFARAFMSHGSLEEPEALESYVNGAGLFQVERNRRVIAVNQSSRPFPSTGSVVYYFVFVAPEINAEMAVRAALAERGQEVVVVPTEKPKKGKKSTPKSRQTADPLQWGLVSPQSSEFRFSASSFAEFERTIRCVTQWNNNSRALLLGNAQLMLPPEHVAKFFSGPFTIEWWQQGIEPSTRIMTLSGSGGEELVEVGVNIYGQLFVGRSGNEASLVSNGIVVDGAWHHIVWSRNADGLEQLFVDAIFDDSITHSFMPNNISSIMLGHTKEVSVAIDELHFIHRAREIPEEFAGTSAIAVRDTLRSAMAIFHFEELSASTARSTIPLRISDSSGKTKLVPITLKLDGKARMVMTSSPVLLEHAVLALDQSSTSKVGFAWKASSEYATVRYELQRRIATFGVFEKVLSVPARRPIEKGNNLVSRSLYSASEKLPTLKRDIDIYYRLAVFGANDSIIDVTTPLKFELGGPKDIFLEQNKPNPFNPKTTIGFTLKRAVAIKLSVFDIIGREVQVIANKKFAAGRHAIEIDATNWPGGIYFYKLKSGNTILTRRMTLAK